MPDGAALALNGVKKADVLQAASLQLVSHSSANETATGWQPADCLSQQR